MRSPFKPGVHKDASGASLPYRLLQPAPLDPQKAYPLVLFFHGSGERGRDNRKQLKLCARRFAEPEIRKHFPCFVVAPQCPSQKEGEPWGWTGVYPGRRPYKVKTEGEPARLALDLVETLCTKFPIDRRRLYIIGISMGAFGVWDIITRHPGKFAAAIAICGGGEPSKAAKANRTPVWVFHGAADPVVPVNLSREMIDAMKAAGGTPRYTEYRNVAHDSWTRAFSEPNLLPWLFGQSRKAHSHR